MLEAMEHKTDVVTKPLSGRSAVILAWQEPWRPKVTLALAALRSSIRMSPLMAALCYLFWFGVFELVRWAVPAARELPELDRIFRVGLWIILGGTCFGIVAEPLSIIAPVSYAIMERGVKIGDRFYAWKWIRGYQLEEMGVEDRSHVLYLLCGRHSRRSMVVHDDVTYGRAVELLAARVPLLDEPRPAPPLSLEGGAPLILGFTILYAVVGGWLLGTFCTSHNLLMGAFALSLVVGPGTIWIWVRHWRELRRKRDALLLGFPYNMLGMTLMMGVALVFRLHRMVSE
jgi:hypothetical protein